MDTIDLLQWPAMLLSVSAAWMIGSLSKRKRTIAFWLFLASNVLWIAWGLHDKAYALIFLQVCLAITNARGIFKNDAEAFSSAEN